MAGAGQTPPGSGGGGGAPIVSGSDPSPKHYLYGSTFTRGISSNRFDRAVVRCLVSNVINDYTGLNAAINAAVDDQRRWYVPAGVGLSALPLAYAKATRFGATKVWVDLYYQRGRVTAPTQPVNEIATFRGTHEHTIVYRSPLSIDGTYQYVNGMPAGGIYFNPVDDDSNESAFDFEPVGRAWRRPVVKIYVTTILPNHPFADVTNAIGKINPAGVVMRLGGFPFGERTLRLDSVDVDWIETYNPNTGDRTPNFITDYVFSATPGGWYYQYIRKRSLSEGTGWIVSGDRDGEVPNLPEFEDWPENTRFPWL